jgi:hypothetical protein
MFREEISNSKYKIMTLRIPKYVHAEIIFNEYGFHH